MTYLMKSTLLFIIAVCALVAADSARADDAVYPAGSAVAVGYALGAAELGPNDTLTIVRTIVNGETYDLTGLYLAEHFPPELSLTTVTTTLNGGAISSEQSTLPTGTVVSGSTGYIWVFDDPATPGGVQLAPGDSLSVILRLTAGSVGTYALPLHTTAFYGNGAAQFAIDQPLSVTFGNPVDTIPPAAIMDLGAE